MSQKADVEDELHCFVVAPGTVKSQCAKALAALRLQPDQSRAVGGRRPSYQQ